MLGDRPVYIVIKASYNGTYFLIHTIRSDSPEIRIIRYVDIVLTIYRELTGTSLGLVSHKYQAESNLSQVSQIKYTPITVTYIDLLDNIAIAAASNEIVSLNNKHDGYIMWLYFSLTVPASLLYQVKTRNSM